MSPLSNALGDASSEVAALSIAASSHPWTCHTEAGSTVAIRSGDLMVESGLTEPEARYLVTLRTVAQAVLGSPLSRRARTRLRQTLETAMRDVGAQWVFVAPGPDGRYYLHNCLRRIGTGGLNRADALFLDAAKSLLPDQLGSIPRKAIDSERAGRRVFIPRRVAAADVAGEYGAFAQRDRPLHALSGRNELPERTEAMVAAIMRSFAVPPGSRVLDIGCGDATLLRRLAPAASRAVGTVLTEAERCKLAAEPDLAGIELVTASLETIDRIRGPFDRIVANGCLHFARTPVNADRALAKLAALLAPGGRIWAGELHATNCRRLTFTSKVEAIKHAHEHYGRSFAIAFARHLLRHRRRARQIVERGPAEWWHVRPEAFAELAGRHGLEIESSWSCYDLTGDTFYALQDRYCCLLAHR